MIVLSKTSKHYAPRIRLGVKIKNLKAVFIFCTSAVSLVLAFILTLSSGPAFASGGDFSLDFTAAAPFTYDHSTGGGAYVPSPVLHKGHLFWVTDGGIAICVDAKTGNEVSKKRIGGQFYASAVLIKDKIFAVSRFSGTYVLEATPALTQVAHNKLSDESDFSGSPAVSDGQLILRSDTYLYCVESR